MQGIILKHLWPSAIHKKPSQTCAHLCPYILLFMEPHLKLNLLHVTEKWHFLCTISKTNNYPLHKTWVVPMTSRSYTCFPKGICNCVTYWCVLVYAARAWHSAHFGQFRGTLKCCMSSQLGYVQYRNALLKQFSENVFLYWTSDVCRTMEMIFQTWRHFEK